MNYIINLVTFITLIISTTTFANPGCNDNGGELRCLNTTVDSIDYKGDVFLDGTTVLNTVKTIGDITVDNATLNHINIVGDMHINNSTINGSTIVVGDVKAAKTHFNGVVKITGDTNFDASEFQADMVFIGDVKAMESQFNAPILLSSYSSKFTHSNLRDLTVKQQSRDVQQVIYLRDRSIINNINFAGNKGVVELTEGSIIKGKLTGGIVTND